MHDMQSLELRRNNLKVSVSRMDSRESVRLKRPRLCLQVNCEQFLFVKDYEGYL